MSDVKMDEYWKAAADASCPEDTVAVDGLALVMYVISLALPSP